MNLLKSALATALFTGAALSSGAATFDFYKLGNGIANDFRPIGTENVNYYSSTGGDLTSSKVSDHSFGGNLKFTSDSITATATATYTDKDGTKPAAVVQDHQPGWTDSLSAGLGVYHINPVDNSDDNVTLGEVLTITFNQTVNLSSIGLRAEGHNYNLWGVNDKFLLNGVKKSFPIGTGTIGNLNLIGDTFTFAFDSDTPDANIKTAQFYLASMTVTAVPDGGLTIAMLGGSMLGFSMLRRRFSK